MHAFRLGRALLGPRAVRCISCAAATVAVLTGGTSHTRGEALSIIGGTLRVEDPGNGGQQNVSVKFLGSADSGLTSELFLDAPTFLGPIFNNKITPVNEIAQLGSFLPETVLFIRNQSFLPSTTGGPASSNFGFFTGDGSLPLNPDRLPHAVLSWDTSNPGVVTVGFEDVYGGGDLDFNDAVYQFTNVRVGVVTTALSPINLPSGSETTVNANDTRAFAPLSGTFTNAGTVDNDGSIINYGIGINEGELNNLANYFNDRLGSFSIKGTVNSSGSFQSAGFVGIESTGIFKNEGVTKVLGSVFSNIGGQFINAAAAQFENLAGSNFQNNGTAENLGEFLNSGALDNLTTMQNSGTFNNFSSGTVNSAVGSVLGNSGLLNNLGEMFLNGVMENVAQFTNGITGDLTNSGVFENLSDFVNSGAYSNLSQMSNSGTATNNGQWTAAEASVTTNDGEFINNSNFTLQQGATVDGQGTFEQSGGVTTLNGTMNQFVNISGGLLKGLGTLNGSVTVGGNGTIGPGNSPGTLSVTGFFVLEEGGTLEIELAAADEYDVLAVTGTAALQGGTIAYVLSFTPELGDQFGILTATEGITGVGSLAFTFTNLPGHLQIDTYLVGADTLVAEVIPEPTGVLPIALAALGLRRRRRTPRIINL